MPNYQKRIVYLSEEQRQELFENGSITVDGQTVTYSDNDMYVTPQEEPYVKPDGGIPVTDLALPVRASLGKADTAYQKPTGGIPSSDLASGVIPSVPVQDVQVNGTSVLNQGVANVPMATNNSLGVVMGSENGGVIVNNTTGKLNIVSAYTSVIKSGITSLLPITTGHTHTSAFYGLAKAAGDSTQSASSNAVGNYTETAKSKISDMFNAPVTVSGTTPSITAMAGVRYICGEVSTLDITVPASGIIDVVFESGSTATVLAVVPPAGMTMKWANGFDPTALQSNAEYEIRITDGELGEAVVYGTGGSNENAYTLIVDETFAEDIVSNTWDLPDTYNEFVINLLVLGTAQNTTETTGQAILRFKNGTCPSGLPNLTADLTSLVRKASYTEYTLFIKRDSQTGITEFHSCPFARAYVQTNLCMVGEPNAIHLTTNDISRYIGAGTKLKIYAR